MPSPSWYISRSRTEEIYKRKFSFVLHRVDEYEDEVDVALELTKEKRLKGIVFLGGHFFHSEEKFEQIAREIEKLRIAALQAKSAYAGKY